MVLDEGCRFPRLLTNWLKGLHRDSCFALVGSRVSGGKGVCNFYSIWPRNFNKPRQGKVKKELSPLQAQGNHHAAPHH